MEMGLVHPPFFELGQMFTTKTVCFFFLGQKSRRGREDLDSVGLLGREFFRTF